MPGELDTHVQALLAAGLYDAVCEGCGKRLREGPVLSGFVTVVDTAVYDFDPYTGRVTGMVYREPLYPAHVYHGDCARPSRIYRHSYLPMG